MEEGSCEGLPKVGQPGWCVGSSVHDSDCLPSEPTYNREGGSLTWVGDPRSEGQEDKDDR